MTDEAGIGEEGTARRGSSNPWRIAGWSLAVGLLLAPLISMRYTSEVNWTLSDFVVMGLLFGLVGLAVELAVRASGSWAFRGGAAVAIVTAFLLIWVNLAVGILGGEANPANLLFLGVIAVAVVGAVLGRFRASGMARAMTAAAVAQLLVGAVALIGGLGSPGTAGVYEAAVAGLLFGGLWLGSGWLFSRAARRTGVQREAQA